jgi:integrase
MAAQVLASVARGLDPQMVRDKGRSAPTVQSLWDRYAHEHLPRKKPSSRNDDEQKARDYILPQLGRLKAAEVQRRDVAALHQHLCDRPYQANRVLALVSKIMNLAEMWGIRPDNTNPCRHIQKFPEEPRKRYLSGEELARLGTTLRSMQENGGQWLQFTAAIKLLLLTGARVSEVLGAKWKWVDWSGRRIILPDSKTGPKPVFLSDEALAILRGLRDSSEAGDNEYILKGRLAGKPLVNLAKPWKVICQQAMLTDIRIHDLRHTAASIGVAQGLSLPIVGRLLGHTQAQTTQRYAHVDADPALVAANAIGAAISRAMGLQTAVGENQLPVSAVDA